VTRNRLTWITRFGAVNHMLHASALALRMRCLIVSGLCTARALHPEITRHQSARAITSDPCPQYTAAPIRVLPDGAR